MSNDDAINVDYGPNQPLGLQWDHHQDNLLGMTETLLHTQAFADVTISTNDGEIVRGHKIVLAASSEYFQNLFMKNPCKNTSIILLDVTYNEMVKLMDYMYTGHTTVTIEELRPLLKAGECLRIKGLTNKAGGSRQEEEPEPSVSPASTNSSKGPAAQSNDYYESMPSTSYAAVEASSGKLHPQSSWTAGYPNNNNIPMLQNAISELQSHAAQRKKKPSILGNSYVKPSEKSPLSRKKRSSLVAASQEQPPPMPGHSLDPADDHNDSSTDTSRRDSGDLGVEDDDKPMIRVRRSSSTKQKNGQRKYKKYTQDTIRQAIRTVREHKMGALEAAKFYSIPSRTLYDKLKKDSSKPARGSSTKGAKRCSDYEDVDSGAKFPYYNGMKDSVYGGKNHGAHSENGDATNHFSIEEDSRRIGRSSENLVMDIGSDRSRSPSPPPRDVEDLSVGTSSNNVVADDSVIVQPSKDAAVKEEEMDAAESETTSEG